MTGRSEPGMTGKSVPGMTGKVGAGHDGKVGAGHDGKVSAGHDDGIPGEGGRAVAHKELKHNNLQDIRAPLWRHAV